MGVHKKTDSTCKNTSIKHLKIEIEFFGVGCSWVVALCPVHILKSWGQPKTHPCMLLLLASYTFALGSSKSPKSFQKKFKKIQKRRDMATTASDSQVIMRQPQLIDIVDEAWAQDSLSDDGT